MLYEAHIVLYSISFNLVAALTIALIIASSSTESQFVYLSDI